LVKYHRIKLKENTVPPRLRTLRAKIDKRDRFMDRMEKRIHNLRVDNWNKSISNSPTALALAPIAPRESWRKDPGPIIELD
jgi:hypothetical protein